MRIGRFVITHPAAIGAFISAAYAVAAGIYGIANHSGTLNATAVTALVAAVMALGIRQVVTPVAVPRAKVDGKLVPLVPAPSATQKAAK